jgi:heme/copper-type cytochrome/quinol oxidase subunit 2
LGVVGGHAIRAAINLGGSPKLEIRAVAHQWWWEFDYPSLGIKSRNEIYFPSGDAVRLDLQSADVIHSFWMPGFSQPVDIFPGKTQRLLINLKSRGEFHGNCDAGCGCATVCMRFRGVVASPGEFARWVAYRRANPDRNDRNAVAKNTAAPACVLGIGTATMPKAKDQSDKPSENRSIKVPTE